MKGLRIGIVGLGFMGRMHYRCWREVGGAEVVAVCDKRVNKGEEARLGEVNIAGAEGEVNGEKLKIYGDWKEMLREEELDAVSITVPTYLHRQYTEDALGTGWHVLCEKPMALSWGDSQRMVKAAEKSGRVLQVGQCLRFWPEYVKAREIAQGGEYGKVLGLSMRRVGSAPSWGEGWFGDDKLSGGMMLDLHIHDADYAQCLLGVPRAVRSVGHKGGDGSVRHVVTQYLYEDDKLVVAEGGWEMTGSFGFEMSFQMRLERATIVYDNTRAPTMPAARA